MTTIITRSGKGTALTHTEVDANFTNLNADKAATADVILATQKGAASGVCPLDATSKVASTYLPSYVDDVLEYANYAALPATGETGKIYVALDTNKTYRWSGSAYVYITSGAVDSVAGKTGVVILVKADVGLGNVDNTTDALKPISTATQTALDLKAPLASPTFTGATTISVTDNINAALRITQLGTGNALVVEDSTNPDASPFVINASGQLLRGITATVNVASELDGSQVSVGITNASSSNDAALALLNYSNTTTNARPVYMVLGRSNGAPHTQTAVEEADELGILSFQGSDGTNFIRAASIKSVVDGTPGTNDMPGRLVFSTTADGASSPTERMRIRSDGNVSIGGSGTSAASLYLQKNITGATFSFGTQTTATVNSDVTGTAYIYVSQPSIQNAVFTTNVSHFQANQGTYGASATVTNQYGFNATSSLTGATNNYGFYGNIPSGTGRYNLYMAGTADNYLGGSLGIGTAPTAGVTLYLTKSLTGSSTAYSVRTIPTVLTDVTNTVISYSSAPSLAASTVISNIQHFRVDSMSYGAGSSATNEAGYLCAPLTGATNNYAFQGNIPAATGRYNLYMSGTADNYLAGKLGIGLGPVAGTNLVINKNLTGATYSFSLDNQFTIQSDVTGGAYGFRSVAYTQATAFTLPTLTHYETTQVAFGAGSAVTSQYGFSANSSLTGATNNYGFFGNIPTGTGRYNLYMAGTADNFLAGSLGIGSTPYSSTNLLIAKNITGATSMTPVLAAAYIQSDVTTSVSMYATFSSTIATAFTLGSLIHFNAAQGTIGATSSIISQYGFAASGSLTGATNNYGFYGSIASGTGRYNLYMAGTANNYMAGSLGIGTSSPTTKLTVAGAITITGAFALRGSYGAGAITSNFAAGDNALASNTTGTNNSAIGAYALQSNTTGTYNSAMGYYALQSNTTGYNNSAIGAYALYSNTTGTNNSAVGYYALQLNTTGINNLAVGAYALQSNTTGYNNSAIGLQALYSNTTGTNNSAMGAYALQLNTTGINNSAVGVQALLSNTTGTYNSAVGYYALQSNTTGSSNLAVGAYALQDLETTTIAATAIVNGTAYQIVSMGTTTSAQWIASGAVTGKVGETFTANATAGVGTGTVATSANIATQCLNNTALGRSSGRGITTGSGNTILGANVTGLAAGLTNNVILANGTGSIRVQSNATTITFADVILPPQAVTASAPAYVKGGMYFDTTLNKMRIGGATAWETVTSI